MSAVYAFVCHGAGAKIAEISSVRRDRRTITNFRFRYDGFFFNDFERRGG